MVEVVGAVDDRRDSAYGLAIPFGYEGRDCSVPPVEGRFRREEFGDTTGKRRREDRIRFVKGFRRSLEQPPL